MICLIVNVCLHLKLISLKLNDPISQRFSSRIMILVELPKARVKSKDSTNSFSFEDSTSRHQPKENLVEQCRCQHKGEPNVANLSM